MGWVAPFSRFLNYRFLGWSFPLVIALGLLPRGLAAQNGVGFWELAPRQEAFMLNLDPSTDAERYSTLRADFIRFGCARNLAEQPVEGEDAAHRRVPQHNVICTLPGKYTLSIVVMASYPSRSVDGKISNGWPEAVILPMLFQALQAQPRAFTYIFADLCGEEGERVFLEQLHAHPGSPVAFIGLNTLGTGVPHFAGAGPKSDRQVRQILENEAWRIANLQGLGGTPDYLKDAKELEKSVLRRWTESLKQTPHVLVFNVPGASVTAQLFHKDFEFLAYYLCALDVKLDPLSGTAD